MDTVRYDHRPDPGPLYWSWRCRVCGEPIIEHRAQPPQHRDDPDPDPDPDWHASAMPVFAGLAIVIVVAALIFYWTH